MSSPAAISNTNESATCVTTIAPRNPARRPPVERASFSAVTISVLDACIAGMRPNSTPVKVDAASVKARTRQSTLKSNLKERSRKSFGRTLITPLVIQTPIKIPKAPPNNASIRLSVSSSLTMRARPAPTAKRVPISLRRALERASNMPATLAQAINNTIPTAANGIKVNWRRSISDFRNGQGEPIPALLLGFELFTSCFRQRVELGPAAGLGHPPPGTDPAALLDPVNRALVAKSLKRINLHRPPRWQITCDERDHPQQHRHSAVSQRVGRRHAEELAGDQTAERECGGQAERQSRDCQFEAFAYDHAQNVAACGPERHSQSDFLRALIDRVAHHAVQSRSRQRRRERC